MGEYAKALELYNKALSIDKDNAEIGNEIVNLLGKIPIIPVSGSYDKDSNESIIDEWYTDKKLKKIIAVGRLTYQKNFDNLIFNSHTI